MVKRFPLVEGAHVQIDGERHLLVAREGAAWTLLSAGGQTRETRSDAELVALYVQGSLVLLNPADPDRDTGSKLFANLPAVARQRASSRLAYIQRVELLMAEVPRSRRTGARDRALQAAARDLGREPVSWSTYKRWKRALADGDPCSLAGRFGDRGRAGLPAAIVEIVVQVMREAVTDAKRTHPILRSTRWMRDEVHERVTAYNATLPPQLPRWTPPSPATFYRMWNRLPAYDRDVVKEGKRKTQANYRAPVGTVRPDLPLDLVEYDETRLPTFFFDELTQTALGRPWLNWLLDVATRMPIGFYLGFEPPGDLTIASTLRHALLPKAYVALEYPDIVNAYPAHGIFRRVTFDNERMAHGATAAIITGDLLSHVGIAPSHTPWFKSTVEGMFQILNQRLLKELPGFALPPHLGHGEYDPLQHGCIGLRYFLYLFHHWLIDIYCQTPIGDGPSPAVLWQRGVAIWPPDLIAHSRDLDVLFGIVRDGRLDHRGVVFEKLRYYSPELHHLRIESGHTQHVLVKVNPSDLGFVHVRDERQERWVRGKALKFEYANGLSLHRHLLNLKAVRARGDQIEGNGLEEAEMRQRALIADSYGKPMSIQAAGLLARAIGLGTQHIFNHVDASGALGSPSGPFTGQALNLWKETEQEPDPAGAAMMPEAAAPTPLTPAQRPRRDIPRLKVDRSLARRPK